MTAATTARNTGRREILSTALSPLSIGMKASEAIVQGTMVAIDTSGRLVNAAATSTLRVIGMALAMATGGSVNLDTKTDVQPGCFQFGNSASGDAIAADDIGKACYVVDNQTVALTDNAGARPFAGIITDVDTNGVWVSMLAFYDKGDAVKNDAGGTGTPFVQKGTGTLSAGVLAVASGVQITASSSIVAMRRTAAGTVGDTYDAPAADRTNGEPGTGAFSIRSYTTGGTAATSDTSTVDWIIVG